MKDLSGRPVPAQTLWKQSIPIRPVNPSFNFEKLKFGPIKSARNSKCI